MDETNSLFTHYKTNFGNDIERKTKQTTVTVRTAEGRGLIEAGCYGEGGGRDAEEREVCEGFGEVDGDDGFGFCGSEERGSWEDRVICVWRGDLLVTSGYLGQSPWLLLLRTHSRVRFAHVDLMSKSQNTSFVPPKLNR
jgi:hypothetical protein